MNEPIRVLLLSGSVARRSYTRTLVGVVEDALLQMGAATTHCNPRIRSIPMADPDFHHQPFHHPDREVRALVAEATAADAFVWASPVHHNSYSAILKNLLDHLAIPQFHYKPVGLLGHGGDRSTQAVDHLRIAARGLLAVAIPAQVCTSERDYAELSDRLEIVSPDILRRVERFTSELIMFAQLFRHLRAALTPVTEDSSALHGDVPNAGTGLYQTDSRR
jgi:azobenzene reductase